MGLIRKTTCIYETFEDLTPDFVKWIPYQLDLEETQSRAMKEIKVVNHLLIKLQKTLYPLGFKNLKSGENKAQMIELMFQSIKENHREKSKLSTHKPSNSV